MVSKAKADLYLRFTGVLQYAGRKAGLADLRGKTVLHVGAHLAQESGLYGALGLEPIWVEADPDTFRALNARCTRHGLGRCVHAAADEKDGGEVDLHVAEFAQCSSLLPLSPHPQIRPVTRHDVAVKRVPRRTVDAIAAELGVHPELIVVDVQGAELRVLRGAALALKWARVVWLEVWNATLYQGTPMRKVVQQHMRAAGFATVFYEPGSSPKWGNEFFARIGGGR